MSRAGAVAAREVLEDPNAPQALLAFLTITHAGLAEPIRVVSDVMDYVFGGETFTGVPFGYQLLADEDGVPRSQLRLSGIDRRISEAVRAMRGRPAVRLTLCSSADFDLSADPRTEIGTAAVIYGFQDFALVNLDIDATEASGEVILQDYATEPFGLRALQVLVPGLFR